MLQELLTWVYCPKPSLLIDPTRSPSLLTLQQKVGFHRSWLQSAGAPRSGELCLQSHFQPFPQLVFYKRLTVIWVRCERMAHGGLNSGRNVRIVNMRVVGTCSIRRPRYSRVDGSIQCRSSTILRTGCFSASFKSQVSKASMVFCLCLCGVIVSGGYLSKKGKESKEAQRGTVSFKEKP